MGLIVVGGGAGGHADAEVIAFEFGVAEKWRRLDGPILCLHCRKGMRNLEFEFEN